MSQPIKVDFEIIIELQTHKLSCQLPEFVMWSVLAVPVILSAPCSLFVNGEQGVGSCSYQKSIKIDHN